MLQVAYGGYFLISEGEDQFISKLSYYEPGFNIMTPLEIQGNKSDYFYILIVKRANAEGTDFSALSTSNLSVSVKDASNGKNVPFALLTNNIYDGWENNPSNSSALVLKVINSIDLVNPTLRVKALDLYIKDTTDNDFISFRVLADDTNRLFNYISVGVSAMADRNTYTTAGREAYVRVDDSTDHYVLFSPYSYLSETADKVQADFSYPLNSIFYKRQKTYNDEDYMLSISAYSHSFVPDMISVMNVPSYGKAGVILIDKMMYTHLASEGENASVDILVVGKLSGVSDIFTVNFVT